MITQPTPIQPGAAAAPDTAVTRPLYQDPTAAIPDRVADLLGRMTLAEKIGQMTLVEKNSIAPDEVTRHAIGALLSGGGGFPADNSPAGWLRMIGDFKAAAVQTRLGIPLLYGVDAVHGHNNLRGAVIFPHNIGLGAAGDADLVRRIARATAVEMAASGTRWNYAPTVAVPQDLRWGRTYEGFGQDTAVVAALGAAYVAGLQSPDLADPLAAIATAKHYVGDGGALWGTSTMVFGPVAAANIHTPTPFQIDQGDTQLDEATLRAVHLAPYAHAIAAGALVVMASFSSWNGQRLHAHRYLLTDVLKGELGFAGFVVSDWAGLDTVHADSYQATVLAINAGVDMNMVPMHYPRFMADLRRAAECGDVPLARIDDAVHRILTVKFRAGLFARPLVDDSHQALVGCRAHRELARTAVSRSLVLLKNEAGALPLPKTLPRLHVAGRWAGDIGLQCGGWTIEWLGGSGAMTPGTTILQAIRQTVGAGTEVAYAADGRFDTSADFGLLFLGEEPYA
ncbi:MAG: glycoside hydrolase family 3 protein, partial [Anaerolineales bacterium]|nr:glycoside hydrolase family 3 protein [Anaerolineales bacterium]